MPSVPHSFFERETEGGWPEAGVSLSWHCTAEPPPLYAFGTTRSQNRLGAPGRYRRLDRVGDARSAPIEVQ